MKAYPAYKESNVEWFGNIPSHWGTVPLKYVCYMKGRIGWQGLTQSEFIDEGPYLITGMNFKNGKMNWDECYHISEERYLEAPEIHVRQGDVLITKDGTIGKLLYMEYLPGPTSLNSHLLILRPRNEEFASKYLYYLLHSDAFLRFVDNVKTGTTFYGITQASMGDFRMLLFDKTEQQAIADFLDRKTAQIDTLIEKKQQQIDLLQEQRTALINHAVTKGLRPDVPMKDSGVEWLGEIPSHWTKTTVRYFYDVKLGKMLDSNKQNEGDLVKPYLRAANIHWNEILLDEVGVNEMGFSESQLERYILQSGDLLVTEGGVTVGRSAIWSGELTECYYQNSLNRARPSKYASIKWLYYWMYFVTNNGFIDILADKSTFGHLTNEKLKALPITIPPESEHNEIIEKLEYYEPKMEEQIALIERQMAFLQEYRTALISEAVTGKIDVR